MPKIDLSGIKDVINSVYYRHLVNSRRYNVFYGGAGSGKSFFVAQRIIYRAIADHGRNFLCVRKVDRTNRDSTFALLNQIIRLWGFDDLFKINKSDMSISCLVNGNAIIFKGVDNPEKIKSITFKSGILTDIWIEEANELSLQDFRHLKLRLRGRSKHSKQLTLTFNPVSVMSWLKAEFFDRPYPLGKCSVVKTTYKDNCFLAEEDKEEIERLKNDDYIYYQIYALGEWGAIGNVIFKNFVLEDFDFETDDFDAVYCGMDFGVNHPTAIECVGIKDGELYVYRELYRRGLTNGEIIAINEEMGILSRSMICIADAAEPDRIREWRQHGYNVHPAKKGKGSVYFGIDFLRRKKVHIHKTKCPGLAAEWPMYKWREDKDGNIFDRDPVSYKDDGIAAVRYALETLWDKGRVVPGNVSAKNLGL